MNLLAINGSPRGARGNTERILQSFLEGAREAGAATEVIYLKDKDIKHCKGCFTCWIKTPGVCVHRDDMPGLLEQLREADVVIYATPLYTYTVSGLMKDFMDRTIPLIQPYIVQRGHHFIHPPRYPKGTPRKYVLISNAGFPQRHHFSALEETMRRLTDSPDSELGGMICCAGGELLRRPAMQDELAWYLEAAKTAGREVVEQGSISSQTQAILDRPLTDDPAAYANMANAWWESQGVEKIGLGDSVPPTSPAAAQGVPLLPPQGRDTVRDIVAGMAVGFNSKAANGLEAVIQFQVGGNDPGNYYLDIAGGKCQAYEGTHPSPSLTIITPAEVWMAISRGEMSGAGAMMTGKYSIKGDLGLLMRFDKLFSPG